MPILLTRGIIAAIVIEDFVLRSDVPLSTVGLQFVVQIFSSERSCFIIPEFIPPTLRDGSCVAIPTGTTFDTTLVALSGSEGETVTEIRKKSELLHDEESNTYHVNITWTPATNQENETLQLCYTSTSSVGMLSTLSCIDLLPGYNSPLPIASSASPNREAVYLSTTGSLTLHAVSHCH